ncbi:MAG: M61 family metallopeptidase [Terriglobales bacterium]
MRFEIGLKNTLDVAPLRRTLHLFVLLTILFSLAAPAYTQTESKLDYTITLGDAKDHRVHVTMTYDPESGGNEVQLPVWNALYQIRDFAKNVIAVKASSQSGEQLPVKQIDKTTWEFRPRAGWVTLDYDIVLDEAGPFGAQFNSHHAFLNFAQVLMYPTNGREFPITVRLAQTPPGWKLATALDSLSLPAAQEVSSPGYLLRAGNYDRLVDSPCELGEFAETDFDQGGARYRVVIDADAKDYDASKLVDSLKQITAAETAWMDDRPFTTYVFIYHFSRGPAGGGMEHAFSTAIDHSANDLKDLKSLSSVSAHEFFHLWNVKRIRPQSLEPIDYTRENYTRALWFSEGVTSTIADLALLKAGLLQPADYLQRLSNGISVLQSRPAHSTQSAEESSLDTWLERYPNYRAPERSISYYNKGELLGVLLDLKIRQDSKGRSSLRDLLRAMNRDYAQKSKFFPDSDGIRGEAEKLTGTDLSSFFAEYVAGTAELPYDELFASVGVVLETQDRLVADAGFVAARNFTGPLVIEDVYGQQARTAGLQLGMEIQAIDGQVPGRSLDQQFANSAPGAKVRITVSNRGTRRDVQLTLGERNVKTYVLRESPQATAEQLARRHAWLTSEDEVPVRSR